MNNKLRRQHRLDLHPGIATLVRPRHRDQGARPPTVGIKANWARTA